MEGKKRNIQIVSNCLITKNQLVWKHLTFAFLYLKLYEIKQSLQRDQNLGGHIEFLRNIQVY